MDKISLCDLEVFLHVGVTAEERAEAQRLLITVEMTTDFAAAIESDDLANTIDYAAVAHRLLGFGDGQEWFLIETLAEDIAQRVLREFSPLSVFVEVKKFVFRQARHVSVSLTRAR